MRICHLTSSHKPNDDRIFYKEAISLAKKYKDIWIVSAYESSAPKKTDGITFKFLGIKPGKLINRLRIINELYKTGLELKADIYHCHEPESLLAAVQLKRAINSCVIFDSHEMYHSTFSQRFPNVLRPLASVIYSKLENVMIKKCDIVIGATLPISTHFEQMLGAVKTKTILNGALPEVLGRSDTPPWLDEIVICHEGSLTFKRGLRQIITALNLLTAKYNVKLKIIGDIAGVERNWFNRYTEVNNLSSAIEITGWLDYTKLKKAYQRCHIGVVAFDDSPNHVIAGPNKFFNYMHFGMPIIVPRHCINMKEIIENIKCGIVINDTSASSFADAIGYLIEHRKEAMEMGFRAKCASVDNFAWPVMERKLLNIYSSLER
ncbi:MAG: glycosyltransferase [Actinomycetota bacterium]|nr:glycosyltransferase [Actinomycetota bacterium]